MGGWETIRDWHLKQQSAIFVRRTNKTSIFMHKKAEKNIRMQAERRRRWKKKQSTKQFFSGCCWQFKFSAGDLIFLFNKLIYLLIFVRSPSRKKTVPFWSRFFKSLLLKSGLAKRWTLFYFIPLLFTSFRQTFSHSPGPEIKRLNFCQNLG